jgi:hypothetical protein
MKRIIADYDKWLQAGTPTTVAPTMGMPRQPEADHHDPPTTRPPAQKCDPSYPDFCISPSDLDRDEVNGSDFTGRPADPHGFDGNSDGVGCESWRGRCLPCHPILSRMRFDHPFDHPDDRSGSFWSRLDRRGIQREQARSV